MKANSLLVSPSVLPESYRESYEKLELRQGVAALQEIHRSDGYKWGWPADVVASVSKNVYVGMSMLSAWKVIPNSQVAGVIDAVRNRLLNILLELREHHPEVLTAEGNLQPIPKDAIRMLVINNIYGVQNVVEPGGIVNQQIYQRVRTGDLDSLTAVLKELSLSNELLADLSSAISEDEDVRGKGIGPKISSWLGRIAESASTSIVTIATQAILRFYGLSGD
ncbi:hypothetical protein IID19_00800 [Patescibacteria group bacterium]|nr:hypothetical protein [Patescibacteria group bacterium]